MNNKEEAKTFTLLASLLGYLLIDNLTSTEQNALGNWLMLVAQTLCTNGSYNFNKDWKEHIGKSPDIKSIFNKFSDSVNKVNNIMK